MRRKDREITDIDEMLQVMESCDVCRLAFHDGEYPYIVPLNFGLAVRDGKIELYFHGAKTGKKMELIQKDNRVSFEMDTSHRLVTEEETGNCTMEYESVMGRGRVRMVSEDGKEEALSVLMRQYHAEAFSYNKKIIPQTAVFAVTVETMTGKRRKKSR